MFLSSFFGYAFSGFLYGKCPAPPGIVLASETGGFFWALKYSEFRRGDENRPQRWILASTPMNGESPPGSLSEGAGTPNGRD